MSIDVVHGVARRTSGVVTGRGCEASLSPTGRVPSWTTKKNRRAQQPPAPAPTSPRSCCSSYRRRRSTRAELRGGLRVVTIQGGAHGGCMSALSPTRSALGGTHARGDEHHPWVIRACAPHSRCLFVRRSHRASVSRLSLPLNSRTPATPTTCACSLSPSLCLPCTAPSNAASPHLLRPIVATRPPPSPLSPAPPPLPSPLPASPPAKPT